MAKVKSDCNRNALIKWKVGKVDGFVVNIPLFTVILKLVLKLGTYKQLMHKHVITKLEI